VKRRHLVIFVTLFLLLGIPAYAYGDPSGGTLFQILMPMLAAIWGMWMIFANNLRRRARSLLQKMRGTQQSEPLDP
jgi:hypothetical protein